MDQKWNDGTEAMQKIAPYEQRLHAMVQTVFNCNITSFEAWIKHNKYQSLLDYVAELWTEELTAPEEVRTDYRTDCLSRYASELSALGFNVTDLESKLNAGIQRLSVNMMLTSTIQCRSCRNSVGLIEIAFRRKVYWIFTQNL